MLRSRHHLPLVLLVLWSVSTACGAQATQQANQQATQQTTGQGVAGQDSRVAGQDDRQQTLTLEARAEQIVKRAREVEPGVTPLLVALAGELGGELYKLEYRLKTLSSTTRKLGKEQGENPGTPVAKLDISDSLRYTLRIDDDPPGAHVAAIKKVLAALEQNGHEVVKIKNYWPKGDNYSGVNSILGHPTGMLWELQFHTTRSIEVNAETRAWYEELREVATPMPRKRELFKLMADAWENVPVPRDIMIPQSLHPTEEIRKHDPP